MRKLLILLGSIIVDERSIVVERFDLFLTKLEIFKGFSGLMISRFFQDEINNRHRSTIVSVSKQKKFFKMRTNCYRIKVIIDVLEVVISSTLN